LAVNHIFAIVQLDEKPSQKGLTMNFIKALLNYLKNQSIMLSMMKILTLPTVGAALSRLYLELSPSASTLQAITLLLALLLSVSVFLLLAAYRIFSSQELIISKHQKNPFIEAFTFKFLAEDLLKDELTAYCQTHNIQMQRIWHKDQELFTYYCHQCKEHQTVLNNNGVPITDLIWMLNHIKRKHQIH
jgi:hypothetical protein